MPLCKKCGLILAASDKVCRGCGTSVEPTAQSPQPPQFPTSSMPESAPLPKPTGLSYSSPLSSAPPPIPSASPVTPSAPPPSPSFATPPPIPSSPLSTPAAPPPTPSFAAPPPLPSTATEATKMTGTTHGTYPPPPPTPMVSTSSQPSAPQPPPPPAQPDAETLKLPALQRPAEQADEPIRIRPKAFKPGDGSKLPPNLDIDKQPVSGVRKPYQPQQQQPPMAQPLDMAQVPPMAKPPIKEQPIYQPFTPPSSEAPNPGDKFDSGLIWAILVLILCCNPIAIASIVLSAIAGGEFKRGDIENAQKHAKLSKIITLIAAILSILSGIAVSMVPTDDSPNTNNSLIQQEETDEQLSDIETEKIIEIIENEMQKDSKNDLKMDIQANADSNGQPINQSLNKDSTDDEIRSKAFIKLYEKLSEPDKQNNDAKINIQSISDNNRQQINSLKNDSIDDEIWREALKKLSVRSKYRQKNVARINIQPTSGNNRQQIEALKRNLNQRDKELWERIRLRIVELQKEEQQNPLRKQIKELNQKEQQSQN